MKAHRILLPLTAIAAGEDEEPPLMPAIPSKPPIMERCRMQETRDHTHEMIFPKNNNRPIESSHTGTACGYFSCFQAGLSFARQPWEASPGGWMDPQWHIANAHVRSWDVLPLDLLMKSGVSSTNHGFQDIQSSESTPPCGLTQS